MSKIFPCLANENVQTSIQNYYHPNQQEAYFIKATRWTILNSRLISKTSMLLLVQFATRHVFKEKNASSINHKFLQHLSYATFMKKKTTLLKNDVY